MRERWMALQLALVLGFVLWGQAAHAVDLGQPLDAAQIARFDITVFPDGRNLPKGQGSVAQGATLFQAQCAGCHGQKGIEGPAARLAGSDGFFWLDRPPSGLAHQEISLAGAVRRRALALCHHAV